MEKKRVNRDFTEIDDSIYDDQRVTPEMRYVYIAICFIKNLCGENYYKKICNITGYDRNTVLDAIEKLEKIDFL